MPQEINRVLNPTAGHTHTPTTVDGQQVCTSCGQIVIVPILSHEDERLRQPEDWTQEGLWFEAVKSLLPRPIDWVWLELSERVGISWPPYIEILADHYDGEPPHVKSWSA